jgi:hypothetical protein
VDLHSAQWRKSSRSNPDDEYADCVEVALLDQATAIRDSKNPGPTLTFPQNAWSELITGISRSAGP